MWPGTKRAAAGGIWHGHPYWLYGLGCLVGWGTIRLLWAIHYQQPLSLNGCDFLLALAGFLGVTGFLPITVSLIGKALAGLLNKAGG